MTYAARLRLTLRYLFGPADRYPWDAVKVARSVLNAGLRGAA